jgi:hypothetical protein
MVCWCFSLREMDKGFVWVELGVTGCACCRRECVMCRSMIQEQSGRAGGHGAYYCAGHNAN